MDSSHTTAASIQSKPALEFLVSADWLVGEAHDEGLGLSGPEFQQRLQERRTGALAIDEAQFRKALATTGRTLGDVDLEIMAELASAKIRAKVMESAGEISQREVAAYYRAHGSQFVTPEKRYIDIYNLHSLAAAIRAKREVRAGRDFTEMPIFHEVVEPGEGKRNPSKLAIEKAIFAASPGVLDGPVKLFEDHSIFKVTRIVASKPEPLTQVQRAIGEQLLNKRQRRRLAAFVKSWQRKWIARTNCSPGFVVRRCRQYSGASTAEYALGLD